MTETTKKTELPSAEKININSCVISNSYGLGIGVNPLIKEFFNSYLENFGDVDEDKYTLIDDGEWEVSGKYQHCTQIYKDEKSNFYSLSMSRSGSYNSDYYYEDPFLCLVKPVTKTIVVTNYIPIKAEENVEKISNP